MATNPIHDTNVEYSLSSISHSVADLTSVIMQLQEDLQKEREKNDKLREKQWINRAKGFVFGIIQGVIISLLAQLLG